LAAHDNKLAHRSLPALHSHGGRGNDSLIILDMGLRFRMKYRARLSAARFSGLMH
jgi:hypothetical protein